MSDFVWLDANHAICIRRLSDGACIPAVPGNRDYDDLIASGAEIAPYQEFATLDDARVAKALAMDAACQAAITGGFSSSALGAAYSYPSTLIDQQNLAANVLSSVMPGLPDDWVTPQLCADSNGAWAYRMHTAAQIQQVGTDGKAAVLTALLHNGEKKVAIAAAATLEAISAVTW